MASQEDDNKLESKSNINKDQERNFINVYKKYENILKSKVEPFTKKIESLIEIWKSLSQCNQENSDIAYIIQIMDWAKLHTLNIVLTGKWKMYKGDYETKLLNEVEKTQNELMKISGVFSKKFQKLADVIRNPWDDPVLANLLHDNNAAIGQKEIEFFCIETAYLVSVRLKKLCESQCEDLALNLVTAFMNCYNLSQSQNFSLNATKIHILFCFDIHVALLYRYNRKSDIVALFKKLTLDEGLHLIRRFAKKRIKISKVWRNYPEITFLAAQVFVTAAVTRPVEESGTLLKDLLNSWIEFSVEHEMVDKVEVSIRRIIQAATAAQHIYICCEVIHGEFGMKLRTFTIELYIRALTTDMNNLESQKTENDSEKLEETTNRLANGFYNLANILKDNVQVSRECALTAFSLKPTLERLHKIEELARLSGFEVLDTGQIWECKLHPAVTSSDDLCWVCNACGKWMCKPNLDLRLTTNFALNEALNFETLGISSQLCDDLAVVLNGPRYHLLSWLLRWEDLHRLCEMYLNDLERTKNLVTELKFVDIDYSMFATVKTEPVDENTGIEKGYESFLYTDDKLSNVESTDSEFSEPPSVPQPPLVKSDPNTLKTLRMFRHNIKRKQQFSQPSSINSFESNSFNTRPSSFAQRPEKTYSGMFLNGHHPAQSLDLSKTSTYPTKPTFNNHHKFNNEGKSMDLWPSKQPTTVRQILEARAQQNKPPPQNQPPQQIKLPPLPPPKKPTNTSDQDFLSNMIKYEFARVNAEMNRNVYEQDRLNTMHIDRNMFANRSVSLLEYITRSKEELEEHRKKYPPPAVVLQEKQKLKAKRERIALLKKTENIPQTKTRDSTPSETKAKEETKKFAPIKELKYKEDETISPSRGFPSFDKIPPPPVSFQRKSSENRTECDSTQSQNGDSSMDTSDFTQAIVESLKGGIKRQNGIFGSATIPEKKLKIDLLVPEKCDSVKRDDVQNENSSKNANCCLPTNNTSTKKTDQKVNVENVKKGDGTVDDTKLKEAICKTEKAIPKANDLVRKEDKEPNISQVILNGLKETKEVPSIARKTGEKSTKSHEKTNRIALKANEKSNKKNATLDTSKVDNKTTNNDVTPVKPKLDVAKDKLDDKVNQLVEGKQLTPVIRKLGDKVTKLGEIKQLTPVIRKLDDKLTKLLEEKLLSPPVTRKREDNIDKLIEEKELTPVKDVPTPTPRKLFNEKPNNGTKVIEPNGLDLKCETPSTVKSVAKEKQPVELNETTPVKESTKLTSKTSLTKREPIRTEVTSNKELKVSLTPTSRKLFDDKPKKNTNRELKIILHRLSDEIIKSFIPTNSSPPVRNCNCHLKKKMGRPRKVLCCKFPTKYNRQFGYLPKIHKGDNRTDERGVRHGDNSDIFKKKTGNDKSMQDGDNNYRKRPKSDSESDDNKPLRKIKKIDPKNNNYMNPLVILERLPLDSNYVRSVLSNVPGLNDYEMMRPTNVNHIVNVVQVSGGRTTTNVPVQNSQQTSTQISPHIQRIGQPRSDKAEHNDTTTNATTAATTSTTVKPNTSQSSTLINILSQQIIRPGPTSNCVRNRSSTPLINILSQQIIRPTSAQAKVPATSNSLSESQTNQTTVEQQQQQNQDDGKSVTTTKPVTPTGTGGTILQFICKSTLPKFQQAFGKSNVYQSTENTETPTTSTSTETADTNRKPVAKSPSVNIQPIQGGVIYTRQMPVGQTINLIPPGSRGQVFRIAAASPNSEQISLVKDTVIHGKMSALLAAALQQGKQKSESDGEVSEDGAATSTKITVSTRPTLVQNARIVKPVLQIPSNVIRATNPQSNLSSTTLEQLREFDMVYKQIKERSSTSTPSDATTSEGSETPQSQRISVTYLNQSGTQKYTQLSPVVVVSSSYCLQPAAASPALSVTSQGSSSPCVTPAPTAPKVTSTKSSKGKTVKTTTTQASKASPVPKPQQKPQEDEHTTQRIFDILAEYAEQLRNSPDLNNKPAPRRRSNPPTNPNQNSKRKKNSGSKKSGQCSSMVVSADIDEDRTVGSEDSSCGVMQLSVQDDEQSNLPPATESNDSTSSSRQQLVLTDSGNNQTRNLIIAADSSVGEALKMPNAAVLVPGNYIMPVSMVKGGQQIAVVSGGSKILATVPARSGPNMLLFQSFLNQNRNKSGGVPTVKYSTIQPISGISSQTLSGVTGQPPVILPQSNSPHLTTVTLGQPLALKKLEDGNDRGNTELLLTISQSRDNGTSSSDSIAYPDSTSSVPSASTGEGNNIDIEEVYPKTPIATPVIAQNSCLKSDDDDSQTDEQGDTENTSESEKGETGKSERVQSVLVSACTSNGPMLGSTRYRKSTSGLNASNSDIGNKEFLHNGDKTTMNNNDQKQFEANATYFQNKPKKHHPPRLDREMHQLCLQRKQAAIERELRLQKSLSEECEDLGVDEPSTSDLFPEADILFDANHSPSFDQSSQDLIKRPLQDKEENKSGITLFSDDDNSSSLRTDFLFESVEYQPSSDLGYDQNQHLTNGQSSTSNESPSSCEDQTLLQNCASMSDVTLNSPVSPDPYQQSENTTSVLNKYKYKYSNRRKEERHKQSSETSWGVEVSSSEDTTGSAELGKGSGHSPESCNKHQNEEHNYKVVAISKNNDLKEDEICEEFCEDDSDCSPSGRGARRSVKKMCSCCNGSQDGGGGNARKRPSSRPHTPAPHKKAFFLNKKR